MRKQQHIKATITSHTQEKLKDFETYQNHVTALLQPFETAPSLQNFHLLTAAISAYNTKAFELFSAMFADHAVQHPHLFNIFLIDFKVLDRRISDACKSFFWKTHFSIPNTLDYKNFLSHHTRQLKFIAKKTERQRKFDLSEGLGCMAICLSTHYNELSLTYLYQNEHDMAILTATKCMEWDSLITQEHFKFENLVLPNYKDPIILDINGRRKMMQYNTHMRLYMTYSKQGYIEKAYQYIEEAMKDPFKVMDPVVVEVRALIEIFRTGGKHRLAYQCITKLAKYVSLADRNALTEVTRQRYDLIEPYYKKTIVPELKYAMNDGLAIALKSEKYSHLRYRFDIDSFALHVDFDKNTQLLNEDLNHCAIDSATFKLNGNTLVLKNVFTHQTHDVTNFLHQIDTLIQAKSLSLNELSLTEKTDTNETPSSDLIHSNDAHTESSQGGSLNTNSNKDETAGPKGPKIKTRGVPHPAPQAPQGPQQPPILMAKALGFHLNGEDVPVYELSGPTVPKGIHYAYGIRLDNPSKKIPNNELAHYQELLEKGKIVNKRDKQKQPAGLRLVKSKETGKPGITFKIRDPDHDLIVLMEREEEVTDDNKHKRILHRAGKAIFHT